MANTVAPTALNADMLLNQWQGHNRLTRRVIEAFPDTELFTFTAGGMRSFGEMMQEVQRMVAPTLHGVLEREWIWVPPETALADKATLLAAWDEATILRNEAWSRISPERWLEEDSAFGFLNGTISEILLYLIDNEIHHRGQGYVYLRLLGVKPPAFYEH